MLDIHITEYAQLTIAHLVLDYNGTLAHDGQLYEGVAESLQELAGSMQIHIVTGDTFGSARDAVAALPCTLLVLSAEDQDVAKQHYVEQIEPEHTVCIGNGRNDRLMLAAAALGIAVIQDEGAAVETLLAADVVCHSINAALGLLTNPQRLTATLRS